VSADVQRPDDVLADRKNHPKVDFDPDGVNRPPVNRRESVILCVARRFHLFTLDDLEIVSGQPAQCFLRDYHALRFGSAHP
jgi:hypothetical protein